MDLVMRDIFWKAIAAIYITLLAAMVVISMCGDARAYWTPAFEECHNFELLELSDVERETIRIITRDWRSKRPFDVIETRYGADVGFGHFPIGRRGRDPFDLGWADAEIETAVLSRWGYSEPGQRHQLDLFRDRFAHTGRLARRAGCRGSCEARVLAYANSSPREVERLALEVGWEAEAIGYAWYKARPTGHRWRRLARAEGFEE